MKKTLLALLLLVSLLLTGCGGTVADDTTEGAPETVTYPVQYTVDGEIFQTVEIEAGQIAPYLTPEPKENTLFDGWYLDEACTNPFHFTTKITAPLTLYAGFTVDAAALINRITTVVIRSVVQVKVTHYKTSFFGFKREEEHYIGSGVIFSISEEGDRAYLLTNCHVAEVKSGKDGADYTIVDYLGREYTGNLYKNVNGKRAISAEYDLACLWFADPDERLETVEYATGDAEIGDQVVSLGYPEGQSNAVTFGTVTGMPTVSLVDSEAYLSNVTFPVTGHTAMIDGGSSGGPLVNANLQLVGVNYAGEKNDDDFHKGYAIPLSKVREFLEDFVYVDQPGAAKPVG